MNTRCEEAWFGAALTGRKAQQEASSSFDPADLDDLLFANVRKSLSILIRSMEVQVGQAITVAKRNPEWLAAPYEAYKVLLVMAAIQDEAAAILRDRDHSTHYYYQLARRMIPALARASGFDWFGPNRRYLRSGSFLANVIRCATRIVLASGKVSEADKPPKEWRTAGARSGIQYDFNNRDDLVACAKVIALAALLFDCQVKFRYASKAYAIFGTDGLPIGSREAPDVRNYETRRDRYETHAGRSGFWIDRDQFLPVRPPLCGWFGIRGAADTRAAFSCRYGGTNFSASFFCMPLTDGATPEANLDKRGTKRLEAEIRALRLLPYDRLIQERGEWYRALLGGTPPDAVVAFLYSLYQLVGRECGFSSLQSRATKRLSVEWTQDRLDSGKLREAGQLGIIRATREGWVRYLLAYSEAIAGEDRSVHKLSKHEVEELIRAFSLLPGSRFDRDEPFLFVVPSTRLIALDLFFAVDFISQLVRWPAVAYNAKHRALTALGDPGGDHLEQAAFEYFLRRFSLARENCLLNSSLGETEVDIAFVYRRVLFVLDCKAKSKNWEYAAGYHRVLRNRATEFKTELGQKLPRRARLIKEGRASNVIEPTSFDRTVCMVCTTAVEYLPFTEPLFWLDSVPLVGPPDEISASIERLAQ